MSPPGRPKGEPLREDSPLSPPVAADDVLVEARVLRLGRTLAFGEISLRAAGSGVLAAHATATYALPSER